MTSTNRMKTGCKRNVRNYPMVVCLLCVLMAGFAACRSTEQERVSTPSLVSLSTQQPPPHPPTPQQRTPPDGSQRHHQHQPRHQQLHTCRNVPRQKPFSQLKNETNKYKRSSKTKNVPSRVFLASNQRMLPIRSSLHSPRSTMNAFFVHRIHQRYQKNNCPTSPFPSMVFPMTVMSHWILTLPMAAFTCISILSMIKQKSFF